MSRFLHSVFRIFPLYVVLVLEGEGLGENVNVDGALVEKARISREVLNFTSHEGLPMNSGTAR